MERRFIPVLCLAFVFMAVLACEGTSGSVMNSSQNCQSVGNRRECEGKFGKLSGTYGIDIEDDNISSIDVIDVEVRVTVESGSVKIFVQGPGGELSSVQVRPGQPATLVGVAEGDFDGFELTFEALDEEVLNVNYHLFYQIR